MWWSSQNLVFQQTRCLIPCNRLFTCLSASVQEAATWFREASDTMETAVLAYKDVRKQFAEGGGARAQQNHVVRNKKILPRKRLEMLFDGGKYLEVAHLVGYGQSYGSIPQAAMIIGLGRVSNRTCMATINDATVKGGTVYPITVQKQLRSQEIALRNRLPTIYIVDSGGAFLPLQSDIFPDAHHGGRAFYNEAVLQSLRIPQLALVCGSCTAGGAYVPTMCEEMGMVEGIGHVFLGGPPLVKAATGEIISADELGGAWMHSNVSGCSDHYFPREEDGFTALRDIVSTLPDQTRSSVNESLPADPLYTANQLRGLALNHPLVSPRETQVHRVYQILARIFDASGFLEFKKHYGSWLVTGFARLNGHMVGVMTSFGPLTSRDAMKGSHFVQMVDQRGLPLICLTHTAPQSSGYTAAELNTDIASAEGEELRAKANLLSALATSKSVKVTVVVGDACGWDYYMMGAKCMSPHFVFAWPTARFGLTTPESETPPFNALQAAGNLWVDDIILPEDTRQVLSTVMDIAFLTTPLSKETIPAKPVLRM